MARCDNCGQAGFEKECRKCGFKVVQNTVLDPGTLVFCESCGCTYWNKCTNGHGHDNLTPVVHTKPIKPVKT